MSRKRLTLRLPQLALLRVCNFGDGELVLSCPKLTEARFIEVKALRVKVEDAVLEILELRECKGVSLALNSAEYQLQGLKMLTVVKCREKGRQVIEDLDKMPHLQTLVYGNFPAACMPRWFPQKLQKISLHPVDWCCDLPRGLKELSKLVEFSFQSNSQSWVFMQPWEELLPMDSLKYVTLGSSRYVCLANLGGQRVFQQIPDLRQAVDI